MKIYIDPGHNPTGADAGAEGNGLREQDVTLAIAQRLKPLLESAGHSVKMSRASAADRVGTTLPDSLRGRYQDANDWGAELFVSIHCNSGGGIGTETLVYSAAGTAATVAARVQNAVVKRLATRDRGVKERPDLAVLKGTKCPAILVETAFIDSQSDAVLLRNRLDDFAAAIAEGITEQKKEETIVAQTVQKLDGIWIQEINPLSFSLYACDCRKRDVGVANYFNAGFFAVETGGKTIPVGNLAIDGKVITQAKDNAGWINVAGKQLSTIIVTEDGAATMGCVDRLDTIKGLRTAISGVPIIRGGKRVSLEEIHAEGYDGSELYNTWHGFLGLRHGKLVYVANKCDFGEMCWMLVGLGIYDAIKLDGGGSFILHNGREFAGTSENRRIHNVGMWEG